MTDPVNAFDTPDPEGQSSLRLVITLRGEAAIRITMLEESTGIHRNLLGRDMMIEGMIEKGLLLKSYEHPPLEKPRKKSD